jgi:hypothetical protein
MQVTTKNLALKRLLFLVLSAVITAVLAWVTQEYQTAAFYPVVYFLLTTARDFADKSFPNK